MRKLVLALAAALVVAAPAHAGGGDGGGEAERPKAPKAKELRISGTIVRLSEHAVAVENRVGDAVLTCLVPERLAEKLQRFEVGDAVRMLCLRHRGRRALLLKLQPLDAEKRADEREEKPTGERKEALGVVAELGDGAIVVQTRDGRVSCRVPAEKQPKLAGLKVGDTVKIWCAGGVLAGLEQPVPADKPKPAEEVRVYGSIAAISREAVTVRGEAGSLTCRVPAGLAEKLVGRFAVGDAVKMMCRGAELTYLEKTG
jgi:hypothetical protein